MPPLVTAGTPRAGSSADAGLPRLAGAVLTVAGHDHQAAAVGAGADGPGDELDSCGTAEALVRTIAPGLSPDVVADLADAGITTGWHAVADHWCLLGATQGGLALQRILALLGQGQSRPAGAGRRRDRVADARERDRGTGIGSLDILGVADDAGPAQLWRAALEAVTEQAAEIHDAMSAVSGSAPDAGRDRWLVAQRRAARRQAPSLRGTAYRPMSTRPAPAAPRCFAAKAAAADYPSAVSSGGVMTDNVEARAPYADQRKSHILDRLLSSGRVDAVEIAESLGVTGRDDPQGSHLARAPGSAAPRARRRGARSIAGLRAGGRDANAVGVGEDPHRPGRAEPSAC